MSVCAIALSVLIGADGARAETKPLGRPDVSFAATVEILSGHGSGFTYRLYYTPARQRIEYSLRGDKIVSIIDDTRKEARILFTARKRYRVAAYRPIELAFGVAGKNAALTRVGSELVTGVPTVKYSVISRSSGREDFVGHAWISANNIVMKLDGQITKGPRTRKLLQTITTIRIGRIDAALFRVPEGYSKDDATSR